MLVFNVGDSSKYRVISQSDLPNCKTGIYTRVLNVFTYEC